MNIKSEEKEYRLDPLKWFVVIALIVAGVVGNSHFSAESLLYRVLGLLVLAVAACFVAYHTAKGANLWALIQGSMLELRKVVWPTRQETNQTTLIVVAVVIVMSIILWLLDTLLGVDSVFNHRVGSYGKALVRSTPIPDMKKKVAASLRERVELHNMQDNFGEILVPTEEVVEMRGGQKRKSERKFFPGYVLVQMELNDDTWHLVKDTPRVMGFIGGKGDQPAPITEKEAEAILRRVDDSMEKPKPKTIFEPGEMVRVTDGPFNDFNGVVEEVNYDKNRLRVAVLIFGRSTPVELEFGQVEKT